MVLPKDRGFAIGASFGAQHVGRALRISKVLNRFLGRVKKDRFHSDLKALHDDQTPLSA
jgi:hypothetical protein